MFKNSLRIALRTMRSNKLFTTLNIAGLAIGLCVFILLFAYIAIEFSFDHMYTNSSRTYRVNMQVTAEYNYEKWAELPNAVGPAILQDVPQVEAMTRLIKDDFGEPASIKADGKTFVEKNLYLADSAVFKLFDFHFIEGNNYSAFVQPKSIVLSQSAKERLFGNQPALNKIIVVNNKDTLHVSGVYADLPANSTIDCAMIYNIMDSWTKELSWSNASFETYCLLRPGSSLAETERQLTALINKYVEKKDQYYTRFWLQPLTDIHLYSTDLRPGYSSKMGSAAAIKSLLFLSLLILFVACINYMNLATARSQKRAKSVGVNKVLGANGRQMALYFYTETAVIVFLSIVAGYALAFLTVPLFRNVTGNLLNVADLTAPPVMISLVLVWLLVTLVAGSYPAFSLSRFSPLALMSKAKQNFWPAGFIRKGLVVFQFTASIILIVGVIVIHDQLQFIRNKNLGYNPNGVVALSLKSVRSNQQLVSTINDVKNLAGIESVSAIQCIPGERESGKSVRRSITDKEAFPVKTARADADIVSTLQLNLLAGTSLPVSIPDNDTVCYTLINEKVASYLGFETPQDAVGKYMVSEMATRSLIVGVVKNFNYSSLKNEIGGYVYYQMRQSREPYRNLLVRYQTQNLRQLLNQLQQVFKADLINTAFDYKFLDQHIQHLYVAEQQTANAVFVFSLLAIFIACLGLFGLIAFTAEQRTREIGIRKVLGASITSVVKLLSADFLKLVALSALIAFPLAWYATNKWLTNFAFRITVSWWSFIVATFLAALLAFLTVAVQSVKAAKANPVKNLRTE